MKTAIRIILSIACFAINAAAFDARTDVSSGNFTSESHPGNDTNVKKDGNQVSYIQNGNWVAYQNFDFGEGAEYLWIEAASAGAGGSVEFRLGSATGTLIGTAAITNTGGWSAYKPFGVKLAEPPTGVKNLYLKCVGGSGNLFNLGKFRFHRFAPDYVRPGAITARVKRDPAATPGTIPAGSFTSESHPNDNTNIRSEGGQITYISNGTWVGYASYDFGAGANYVTIQGASPGVGGTVELRLDNPTSGQLIGTVAIPGTGSWSNFQSVSAALSQTVTGVRSFYLRFVGGSGYLLNIKDLYFDLPESRGRLVAAQQFDQESSPGVDPISGSDGITSVVGGTWVAYNGFSFGDGVDLVTIMAATPNKGGAVKVHIDSPTGPLISTVDITHTGSFTHYREYTATTYQTVSGTHDLYLKFVDSHNQGGNLFNVKNFIVEKKALVTPAPSNEGTLFVYDPVTGLNPSPYYTYSVQKVSDLNAPLKQDATNWFRPFAWFTECKEYRDSYPGHYYVEEVGGWSNTYCNFEMGKNTPIVVKISRNSSNLHGAPAGPIFMANVHPAHKVQSCEIINGEVYVTMSEPALVTVDIDGQMDTRDAPRTTPDDAWYSKPYNDKPNGSHAVSIFANPFLTDMPVIGDPGVIEVKAGQALPAENDTSWTTLYFGKGVHSISGFDTDGKPKKWEPGDNYVLQNGKTVYISGDAIVYGCFDSRDGTSKSNIRIYGRGTLSGRYIPHYKDSSWSTYPGWNGSELGSNLDRPFSANSMSNCRIEGVTLADPANHGISSEGGGGNLRSWLKQIAWRANSDMGGVNGVVEDCFFRLQDDGPYVNGHDFRRNTLWFDCNGTPFRGTFIKRDTFGAEHQTVIEDCDVIYVRSNFGSSVFSIYDYWQTGTYSDGAKNTVQHMIFRNIRVTDPRPTRTPFGYSVGSGDSSGIAGIRFENIEFRNPHSWGKKSGFSGTATTPIHHLYFDGVFIEGRKLDAALLADTSLFETSNISDFVFRDFTEVIPSTYTLETNATNGTIALNPPGGVYDAGTVVTVTATPNSGYRFLTWGGDLSGTLPSATVTMDGHKSITASFIQLIRNTTVDTTGATIVLNYNSPANNYIGNGSLQISGDGGPSGRISLGQGSEDAATTFAMTGGLITIDSGVTLVNGGWQKGIWSSNLASIRIDGILDLWDGNPVSVDALTGGGRVIFEDQWDWNARILNVGVNGGSGTFSGEIEAPSSSRHIRLIKWGSGTQTLNNLAIQKPKEITINQGSINLVGNDLVTMASNISGAGNLTKSGAGVLTLSGSLGNTGVITVSGGTLGVTSGLSGLSNLVVASGAILKLNFTGEIAVNSLKLGDSGALPAGLYSSSHPTYGVFFTGSTGSLRIIGSDFDTWVTAKGVTGGPNDDDDKDGRTNHEEYAFGLLPANGSSVNPIVVPLSGNTFSYTRRKSSLTTLTYSVWYSNSLEAGSWTKDNGAVEGTPVVNGDMETVPVTISSALLSNPKLFIQVRAE